MNWKPVTPRHPPEGVTCFLYRTDDLYPVVGSRCKWDDGIRWILEEGGPEDSEDRRYPLVANVDGDRKANPWQPTHYATIDFDRLPIGRPA